MAAIMDLSPTVASPSPRTRPTGGARRRPHPRGCDAGAPRPWSTCSRNPYEQIRAVRASTRVPRQALHQAVEVALRPVGHGGPRPARRRRTSLNRPHRTPHRRYGWASTSVDDISSVVRKSLGGTFNDVVLAAISPMASGTLLLSRKRGVGRPGGPHAGPGVGPAPGHESGGPWATGRSRTSCRPCSPKLPVGISDPVDRLHAISAQMAGLKDSKQAVAGEALTSMSGFAPPMLLALGMRLATRAAQYGTSTPSPPMCPVRRSRSTWPAPGC